MKHLAGTHQAMDLTLGSRLFNACWLSAGFGLSMLQMLLLAQAWRLSQQALVTALLAGAWALGSLVGTRCSGSGRLWGAGRLACALLWLGSLLPQAPGLPPVPLDSLALALLAALLGVSGTAWLSRQRAWPAAGERTALVRSLVGLTVGLLVAWTLPASGGLLALACCLPLLALDIFLSGHAPLPPPKGVAARWTNGHWSTEAWTLQLERHDLLRPWRGLFQRGGLQPARRSLPLIVRSSIVAVVLGSVWGAVPTPFAASLRATHSLDVLCWLLGGQTVALAFGAYCLLAARNGIGFPGRLIPSSWQSRVRWLALLMPLAMAASLAALGVPALQARWWLALSLAGYTLANAVWSLLLPRLLPNLTTMMQARRHLLLPKQDARLADPLHLAHARGCEASAQLLQARVEGLAVVVCTPLLGWLIDRLGSVDAVLVVVGLAFSFGLLCAALVWALARAVRGFAQTRPALFRRGPRFSGSSFPEIEATATH